MLKCIKCGYEWKQKKKLPKECPKCKSRYWNKLITTSTEITLNYQKKEI